VKNVVLRLLEGGSCGQTGKNEKQSDYQAKGGRDKK